MADVVDKATRSRMMAGIRGVNTAPEINLRHALHAAGFRYRIHAKELPGRPDLVFPRFRVVVFVHGCFWHRHAGCKWATTPSTNTAFWEEKLNRNMARDARDIGRLQKLGWRVAVVWECAMRVLKSDHVAEAVGEWLVLSEASLVFPQRPLRRLPKE
jgi:DNA mismatch endonuclease, patch repair protein